MIPMFRRTITFTLAAGLLAVGSAALPSPAGATSQFQKFWSGQLVDRRDVATATRGYGPIGIAMGSGESKVLSGPDFWGGVRPDARR